MMKTIAVAPGEEPIHIEMTQEEISTRQAEEAANLVLAQKLIKNEERRAALAVKWPDAFALLDDILAKGLDAVKAERDSIKLAHPKAQ